MGLSLKKFALLSLTLCIPFFGYAHNKEVRGQILFLTHQGKLKDALSLYLERYCKDEGHDSELLEQLGLAILENGSDSSDSEIQLLTLFGAGIARNPLLMTILEKGVSSRDPEHQLASLRFLSDLDDDRANDAIFELLSSPYLIVRLEAALTLAEKNYEKVFGQIEALMAKMPNELKPIFPQLFVLLKNPSATKILRQLLNDESCHVRIETVLQASIHEREDLLASIRAIITHPDVAEQEACAFALGQFKDHYSSSKLKKLSSSSHIEVRLAASFSLYLLGDEKGLQTIVEEAHKGNPFAISLCGDVEEDATLTPLLSLVNSEDINIRFNAVYALLKRRESACLKYLDEFIFKNPRDLVFIQQRSLGHALKMWRAIPSAAQRAKDAETAYAKSLHFREQLLRMSVELSEKDFLTLARKVFQKREDELVPLLVDLLINHNSLEALQLLKEEQQKAGAPFIRHYCTLALYRAKEEGPYEETLLKWVEQEKGCSLIRFRKMVAKSFDKDSHYTSLTPEEKSHLLVECYEALASKQNEAGILTLLHAIKEGHPKNKYALAGLLLRSIE